MVTASVVAGKADAEDSKTPPRAGLIFFKSVVRRVGKDLQGMELPDVESNEKRALARTRICTR